MNIIMIKRFLVIITIISIILILLVRGCSISNNVSLTYTGESVNWHAEYTVVPSTPFFGKNSREVITKKLILTFKNDISQLSKIRNLEYSYESSVSKKKATIEFPKEKIYTLQSQSNGAKESEDEIIKVFIVTDGKEELIELKNMALFK